MYICSRALSFTQREIWIGSNLRRMNSIDGWRSLMSNLASLNHKWPSLMDFFMEHLRVLWGDQLLHLTETVQGIWKGCISRNVNKFNHCISYIERNTEIERSNRILLEKITNIMRNKHNCTLDALRNFKGKKDTHT